jgi:4-carboxymuconolactone decarboxylase
MTMRLAKPVRPSDAHALYATIIESRKDSLGAVVSLVDGAGELLGPFPCLLHSPVIGSAVQQVGTSLRESSDLPEDAREAATLAVAVHWQADYEWYAHEAVAREKALVAPEDIERIGHAKLPRAGRVRLAVEVCHALLRHRAVPEELYERATHAFGQRGVVELVLLIGYYTQLAMLITTFETPSMPGIRYPWDAVDA